MRYLIHLFKYRHLIQLRRLFCSLMIEFVEKYQIILACDLIIPIPLNFWRSNARGFNQAQLLAAEISKNLNAQMRTDILARPHYTPYQARLRQKERWTNMDGAFTIKRSVSITNKNILLIDDLTTTGATLSSAAWALKQSGANKVNALTLAISPRT